MVRYFMGVLREGFIIGHCIGCIVHILNGESGVDNNETIIPYIYDIHNRRIMVSVLID